MVCTSKRLFVGFLAFFFTVVSVLFPITASAATYNAASNLTGRQWAVPGVGTGVAGNAIVATAATMLGRANPWIAAISLGTPVMQYLLEKNGGDRLAIRAKDAPVPTPPGWTPNTSGIPSPPATSAPIPGSTYNASSAPRGQQLMYEQIDSSGQNKAWATQSEACAAMESRDPGYFGFYADPNDVTRCLASKNAPFGGWGQGMYRSMTCSASGEVLGQGCTDYSCPTGGTLSGTSCVVAASCKSGYAMSQGYCTITDPWSVKWPADGIGTLQPKMDGSGFEPDPRDPDPAPDQGTSNEIHNPGRDYRQDQFGNPTSTSIEPQSGGGYKIDQRVQTTNNNQTTTTINNITINNAGSVTSISSTTVPGPIDAASPTATPAAQKIEFPTDYNRENTQLAVKSKLDEIQAGTGAANAPDYQVDQKKADMNQEVIDKADAIPGQYASDKGNWFSWVWTPPVGQCTPWVNSIHGQTVTWDVCPYVAKIRDVIGYLLAIATTWAVYLQIFRRED